MQNKTTFRVVEIGQEADDQAVPSRCAVQLLLVFLAVPVTECRVDSGEY